MVLTTTSSAGALARQQRREVGDRLGHLGGDPTVDQGAVPQAQLAAADQPVAGPHDRRVGPDRPGPGSAVSPSSVMLILPRRVGHRGGRPWAIQVAAATAAKAASEPRTGCRSPAAPARRARVIGGVSRARRIPNDRMVRSSGTPVLAHRDGLRADPAERHVGGAGDVRAQHRLVEGIPAPTRSPRRPAGARRRRPSPPPRPGRPPAP